MVKVNVSIYIKSKHNYNYKTLARMNYTKQGISGILTFSYIFKLLIMELEFQTGIVMWLGLCPDPDDFISKPRTMLQFSTDFGIKGDHHGFGRIIDARERALLHHGFSKGIPISNTRTWSLISLEEVNAIEKALVLSKDDISRGYFGENIVISGI